MSIFGEATLLEVLTHVSSFLILCSFLVRDMLWLRLLAIISSLVWIAAMVFGGQLIMASLIWNGVFISINIYQIAAIIRDNRAVEFTQEEREVYETLFRHFKPGEFLKILRVGEWRNAPSGDVLLTQGQRVPGVSLITEGESVVEIDGEKKVTIGELDLFGEIGYLTGNPASATIRTKTDLRYVYWSVEALERFFKRHPSLKFSCHSVITNDLGNKLARGGDFTSSCEETGDCASH